jgi:AraC-type DNA-binding domain-containing proteins
MDIRHSRALGDMPSQGLLKAEDWFLDSAIPIDIWRTDSAEDYPIHRHDFFELVVIVRGSIDHRIADKTVRASAGDVFGIPPGVEHGYSRPESCDYISIIFEELGIETRFPELRSIPEYAAFMRLEPSQRQDTGGIELLKLAPADLIFINDCVRRIEEELERKESGYTAVVSAFLLDILVTVCRRYTTETRLGSDSLVGIARAIRRIEGGYAEALDLEELVAASCMSKRSFMRHFRSATGDTPMSYLRRVRIEAAKRLLAAGGQAVTEVAAEVGFEDSNHFSRVFKEETGSSPLKYRRDRSRVKAGLPLDAAGHLR